MDLKILRYFLTVAQTKNITKAAELLHITQPTLSRQLILLEESLKVKLFVKEKRTIGLTDEGKLLKIRAREILDLADKTVQEILDENSVVSGEIAVGCVESFGAQEIYQQMGEFSSKFPNVVFNLFTASSEELLDKMEHGTIDICLLLEPVDTTNFNVIRLSHYEEWGILVRNDDTLAKQNSISVKELSQKTLILPMKKAAINEIENWFGKNKYKLNVAARYNVVNSVVYSADNNMGYPIVINCPIIDRCKDMKFLPIEPIKRTQSVVLWKKNRNLNSASSLFVKTLFRHYNPVLY
ncbi:LysR family transcriptional regulator [Photobacterium rosenbergii]|uniref:LysR family transcriptional regulator n=1 Tax=Photobacterium rosenbergii TaxID=294936 RepID=A0ABU3ZN98_9GAMM|nr:LysR family transcriptional regulator [Photobacterium rosenbergii]MDV5171588.1 LysR family transcriptional regulator [Photobacterium rosenbergii]